MRGEGKSPKPLIYVAAGCLINAAGEVLIAQRPEGKVAAGYWEFPGGKIEPGETALAALKRELHEELGVEVRVARPLIRFRHDYSDRSVVLDTWLISAFDGVPHGREAQAFAWVRVAELGGWPNSLPTVAPIAQALGLPSYYVFTPADADETLIRNGLPRLPSGALLRLRLPDLGDDAYRALALRLLPECRRHSLQLILDRAPEQSLELDAAGWHGTAARLATYAARPLPAPLRVMASCHDPQQLAHARRLECDAAVLGPVRATPTHPEQSALGWDRFEECATACGLPTYAIGGVGPGQLDEAFAHYAQGTAGIRAYWNS